MEKNQGYVYATGYKGMTARVPADKLLDVQAVWFPGDLRIAAAAATL